MSVPLARRNLFHEKGKLFLSVAGVAAALTLVLLLLGFRTGLYATLTAYVDNIGADLIVVQSGVKGMFSSNSALPLDIHNQIVQTSNAVDAGHILLADVIFSRGDAKTPVLLIGFQPGTTFGAPWKIGQGRMLTGDDEIMLDAWLAQRNGISLGDNVDLLGSPFKVVGLTRETASWMSPYIFITLNAADQALGLSGIVSYHLLRLPEGADIQQTAANLEAQIPGIDALRPDQIADADKRILATIMDAPINVMLLIGVIIGVAVMGLTAYTAVTDRMREYGVLKAIGANSGHLTRLVFLETVYRAVLGYLFGVGLALLTASLIMGRWPQFTIIIRPQDILIGGALTVVMTLLAALLPIQRLKKIDPLLVFKS